MKLTAAHVRTREDLLKYTRARRRMLAPARLRRALCSPSFMRRCSLSWADIRRVTDVFNDGPVLERQEEDPHVIFTKRLREGVRRGEITCSVRIWMRPHVKVGNRYTMGEGQIEVDSLLPISLGDITPELARASGFKGVIDLLKVAKHGRGENVYLVRFHYVPPRGAPRAPRKPAKRESGVAAKRGVRERSG